MSDRVRDMIVTALEAANFGDPLPAKHTQAIREGRSDIDLSVFDLDSLGVMEFCISVELQSGLELTPMIMAEMKRIADIESWLRHRL